MNYEYIAQIDAANKHPVTKRIILMLDWGADGKPYKTSVDPADLDYFLTPKTDRMFRYYHIT